MALSPDEPKKLIQDVVIEWEEKSYDAIVRLTVDRGRQAVLSRWRHDLRSATPKRPGRSTSENGRRRGLGPDEGTPVGDDPVYDELRKHYAVE